MAEQSLKDKTAKGLFWGGVSNGVQQLLGMLFGIYLARTLNAEDYGLVGMLAIFSGIASTIINSGFSVALTNKLDATHKDYNAVFWFSFVVSICLYIVLFFSAPLIASFYDRQELVNLSRVIFASFLFSGMAIVPHVILFKQLQVKMQAKIDVFALFLSGMCGVLLAFNGFAYWALAIQSTVYVASASLLKWMVVSWRPSLDFSIEPLKEMFPFSVKLFLTNIFQQVNNNVFSVLLGKLYNANVLGYYSQGNKWMTMGGSMLNNMINSVAQPVFVQVNDDLERQRNVFRKMVRFAAFVSFPAMLGLAFVAEEFICATIGNKWLESVPILQILCVQGAIGPSILLYTQVLVSHGKSDMFLYANVFHGILQLAILWLTASFGILCMVVAYVLTYVFMLFVWHLLVYRLIRVRLVQLAQDVLPYLVVTLFVFFVVYFLTIRIENIYILLLLKISLSILFYAFVLWRLRSVVFLEGVNLLLNKWRK